MGPSIWTSSMPFLQFPASTLYTDQSTVSEDAKKPRVTENSVGVENSVSSRHAMSQGPKKRKAESSTPAASAPSAYSMAQGNRTATPGWSGHSTQIPIDPALQQQPQQQQQPPPQQHQQQQQQQQQQQPPPQQQQPQQQQQQPSTQQSHQQTHPLPPPQHPQQQPQYHPGTNYYTPYNYAAGYPPPTWPTAQARAQPVAAPMHPHQQTQQQHSSSELDTADVATLNDALGSAGVDLRAEEENLRQSHSQSQAPTQTATQPRGAQRSRAKKQGTKFAFDAAHLGSRMRSIATRHALQAGTTGVPEDTVTYLALALRVRLSKLIEGMSHAAEHREETGVLRPPGVYVDGTPMWTQVVRRDVAKQLALLERVEREEELAARRERKARESFTSSGGQTALPSLDDALPMEAEEEPKKKKKKPDGPGVTAKNMSEDMKKKLSNAVASRAAGLGTGKYAWMNAGNIPTGPPAKKATGTTSTTSSQQSGSGWSKPYQPAGKKKEEPPAEDDNRRTITLKDAIFVVERERGHGGGRGAARGWT